MNQDWSSVEIRGNYPRTWNAAGFSHEWNGYEELIIERGHQKALERAQGEKLMPRERIMKSDYDDVPSDLNSLGLDRFPSMISLGIGYSPRILDSFAEVPPVVHANDLREYPELYVMISMLRMAKFPCDAIFCSGVSFGEEVLTSKFRNVEHGPPLAVEGLAQVKDPAEAKARLEFFGDNIPDPALRGYYPYYLWFVKQIMKINPEYGVIGSACTGPIASATFLRGPREFLMDIRKNPPLAELALKVVSKYVCRKIERLNEVLTASAPMMAKDSPNGNEMFYCDGGGAYLTFEEFTRTYDFHFGPVLDLCTELGIPPFVAPLSSTKTAELFIKYFDEHIGGRLACDIGLPVFEDALRIFENRDKTKDITKVATSGFGTQEVLVGGKALLKGLLRDLRGKASTELKGLRCTYTPAGGANHDVQTPLAHLDELSRLGLELYKFPLKVPSWLEKEAEG
jgi:hypothetical protein